MLSDFFQQFSLKELIINPFCFELSPLSQCPFLSWNSVKSLCLHHIKITIYCTVFFIIFWFRRDIKTMWNTKAKRISKGFFYSTINLFIWNKFGKLNVRHNLYVKQVFPWKLRNASPPCPLWNFQKPVNSFSTKLIYFFRDLVWKILVQKHFQY